MDFEVEGVKIPEKVGIIVKNDHSIHPLIVGMNVIGACWDVVFKHEKLVFSPPAVEVTKSLEGNLCCLLEDHCHHNRGWVLGLCPPHQPASSTGMPK